MNIFLTEEEEIEIPAINPSEDLGRVITPGLNQPERSYRSDLEKEIIGIDTIDNGSRLTAPIHGVNPKQAREYAVGQDMNEDSRSKVLAHKHEIQDLAITKLMDTLNLLDPSNMEKTRDQIAFMNGLSTLVDKVTDKKTDGTKVVHLHLYGPKQKVETDYEVIDV